MPGRVRLKILVIDEEFPYPLNTGKRIRTFSLTKSLTRYNDVSYLAYGSPAQDSFKFIESNGITCHAVPPPDRGQYGPAFYWRLFANLFSDLPYIVTSHHTGRYADKLRELQAAHGYDLVICEWTPYAMFLKTLDGVKSIVVAHNIESNIWRRYEQNESNPFKRKYISIQRKKVENFERKCFAWSSGATAVSDIEAEEIAAFGVNYPVQTIENGVDTSYFAPIETVVDPNTLVFTGSMDWRPNQDAIEFFAAEIFPKVKAIRPEARVIVVGRRPPEHIRELGKTDGITITGTVEDVRPYIAGAALYVVPLRVGGGSRLKILEAMGMQKPVLSTSVGAEGLEVTDGEDIVIADGAQQFADSILRCLDNQTAMSKMAEAGHRLVEKQYRWESLGEKLDRYLAEVVARP